MSSKYIKLFYDSLDVLDQLTDEQAGQLLKAIRQYSATGEETLQGLMSAVFTPFKNGIDRANKSYDDICEVNKANGLKGGRPKRNKPNGFLEKPTEPKKPKEEEEEEEENKPLFESLWKMYTLGFLKHQGRSGGTKTKALKHFNSLMKKYRFSEVEALVNIEMNLKIGHRDLERVLTIQNMEQSKENMIPQNRINQETSVEIIL